MNKFIEEKDNLLNCIGNNTREHWKNYYKDVPIECIYDDLVLDINEIKRLTEENDKLKKQQESFIDYLEKEIKSENETWKKYGLDNINVFYSVANQVTLEKYKEIIGGCIDE